MLLERLDRTRLLRPFEKALGNIIRHELTLGLGELMAAKRLMKPGPQARPRG